MDERGNAAEYKQDKQAYIGWIELMHSAGDNSEELSKLQKSLAHALEHVVTPSQRHYLIEYYVNGKNMREIAEEFHVDKTTVSRGCSRGIKRLRRYLMYTSEHLVEIGLEFFEKNKKRANNKTRRDTRRVRKTF